MTPEEQFRMLRSDDVWPVDVRVETVAGSRGERAWPIVWRTVAGVAAIALVAGAVYGVVSLRGAREHSQPVSPTQNFDPFTRPSPGPSPDLPECGANDVHVASVDDSSAVLSAWLFSSGGDCALHTDGLFLEAIGQHSLDGLVLSLPVRAIDSWISLSAAGAIVSFDYGGGCSDDPSRAGQTVPWSLWRDGRTLDLGRHPLPDGTTCFRLSVTSFITANPSTTTIATVPGSADGVADMVPSLRAQLAAEVKRTMNGSSDAVTVDADGRGITAMLDRAPAPDLVEEWRGRASTAETAVRFIVAPLTDECRAAVATALSTTGHDRLRRNLGPLIGGSFSDPTRMAVHFSADQELTASQEASLDQLMRENCPGAAFDVAVDHDAAQNDLSRPPAVSSATPTP